MTVQSRSTLKSYFITGASPSEAEFSDLIDSTLLVGDIEVGLASTSSVNPLSASAGKSLNDKIVDITSRVVVLEGTENTFASNYYNKSEVDSLITAVDQVIYNLTYQSQINDLQDQIDNIDTTGSPSSISIGNVTGLQDALDAKATIAELNSTRDALQASIDSINTDGVDLSGIEQSIASLTSEIEALETSLVSKAEGDHTHSEYYTKTEVDTLVGDISVEDHTHTASDITDLNQEIEQKTNLLVSDHSELTNNPHRVTKAQVGLGKVENLSPPEIVAAAGIATDESLANIEQQLLDHTNQPNPHGTSKSDIGLGNVPNVDVQQLLDLHLQAENPHDIDLNFFDVYSTAEADSRMQFYIDSVRYAFTPAYSGDSAGALGDIAWDDDFLYFKQQPTKWVKVPFSSIEEFNLDNVTKLSAADIEVTGSDGSTLLSVSDNGVEIGEGSIGSLSISDTDTETVLSSEKDIEISAPTVSINNLYVNGGEIIGLDGIYSWRSSSVQSSSAFTESSLAYIDEVVTPVLKISDFTRTDSGRAINQSNPAEFTYSYDLARWISTVDSTLEKFAYLADLPDLSPYALKSELPSNIGQGGDEGSNTTDVLLSGSTGGLDNYAFTSGAGIYADDPDTPGDQEYWAYSDDILSTGLVIDYGYGVNNPSIKYNPATEAWEAFDGVTTFGIISPYTKDEIDSLIAGKADLNHTHSQYALTTDLLTFVPYTQPEVNALLDGKADAIHTHAQYALIENLPNFDTFSLKADLSDYATLEDLAAIETSVTNVTNVTEEVVFNNFITLDASGGGARDGYAFTEGAGIYADDPNTPGDQEYWALSALGYFDAGIDVDIGQGVNNPSIKWSVADEEWVVSDGVTAFKMQGYSNEEIDALIEDFEVVGHTHSQYALTTDLLTFVPYTKVEVNDLLSGKANASHTHAQYALIENLPNFNTFALKADLSDYATLEDLAGIQTSTTNITNVTQEAVFDNFITLDASSGGARDGYAFTEGAGIYADDPDTPGDQEYWALSTLGYFDAGIDVDIGQGVNNPSIRWSITDEEWVVSDGVSAFSMQGYSKEEVDALIEDFEVVGHTHSQYALKTELLGYFPYTTAEVDALVSNVESSKADAIHYHNDLYAPLNHTHSQYALTTDIPDLSNYATLSDLASIDTGSSDTGGLFDGTITIDSSSSEGYAETKYPDGSGGFVSLKYSVDYGADGTYGTPDDDETEDYFSSAALGYSKAGVVVDVGQFANNPSIKYDPSGGDWEVFDGSNTFNLKDVDVAVANLVDSAPGTLDTLNELAAALGDDPNFATTTSTALGNRVRVDTASQGLSSTQKSNARTNIGAASSSHNHSATNITSGTLSISRIPTGTTSTTVCKGNDSRLSDARTPVAHNHSATNITSGTLSLDRIPSALQNKYPCLFSGTIGAYLPMVPGGLYATSASSKTGAIKIKIPTKESRGMQSFFVDIYDYAEGESMTFKIGLYNSTTVSRTSVVNLSDNANRDFNVRFYTDTDEQYLTIGETTSVWSYPQIAIRDLVSGYATSQSDALAEWSISFVTSTPGTLHATHSNNYPAIDYDQIDNKPSTFTPSSHTHDDRYYTESEVDAKLAAITSNLYSV